jgi:hypothetical protein
MKCNDCIYMYSNETMMECNKYICVNTNSVNFTSFIYIDDECKTGERWQICQNSKLSDTSDINIEQK